MTDWRPDWQDEQAYAFTSDLSPEGWAWQFVRRNPEYQLWWEEEESYCRWTLDLDLSTEPAARIEPVMSEDDAMPLFICGIRLRECAEIWGFYPPLNPSVDELHYPEPEVLELLGPESESPMWDIVFLPAPAHPLARPGGVAPLGDLPPVLADDPYWEGPYQQGIPIPDRMAVGFLDLDEPLEWQLEQIQENAERLQARRHDERPPRLGRRRAELQIYLRVLDADSQRADRVDVARELWPDVYGSIRKRPKRPAKHNREAMARERREAEERNAALAKVRDTLRTARKMLEPGGYLRLIKLTRRSE